MKILFVINSLCYKSGTERVACSLANSLAEKGYKITIVNRDTLFDNVAYDLNDDIVVKKISGNLFNFYKELAFFINDIKPHYVVVHNMGKLSLMCGLINIKSKYTRLISLEHVAFKSRPLIVQIIYKFLSQRFHKIVALTNHDAFFYRKFHKNVVVINNFSPFDVSSFNYSYNTQSRNIIAIGRLTYQKNFDGLINIWKNYKDKNLNSDWTLEIYGEGDDFQNLKNKIESLKISNIYLRGQTADVASIYKRSSIFVMTSRYEGLPMVLLEAQTFGLPIISYDCPFGPSEVIENGVNGYLIENNNENSFSQALQLLTNDPDKRKNMSINSMENSLRFSKSFIIEKWIKMVFNV